jgi:predicted exporter
MTARGPRSSPSSACCCSRPSAFAGSSRRSSSARAYSPESRSRARSWRSSGVKLNFLNFIVFPITFGIGADYAFNILRRYEADGAGTAGEAVKTSGGAVALCSLTTIIGYGTLLVSDNRALNSFGALAGAGEVACLAVALILTPSLLVVLERRSDTARSHP